MTKLEQLIEELCPNGVEYHELGKIAEMQRGTSITKKNVCEGEIPVISGGREPAYYCDTFNREGETITVAGSGADLAKKYRENNQVVHCILAHHGDVEPGTVEAVLVQAADAISAARPGARRETLENYIKRLEKLEEIANSFDGVDKSFAIQAGREVRIMVKSDTVSDTDIVVIAKDIVKRIESELEYPGQIKVNVIRETRATEYAK